MKNSIKSFIQVMVMIIIIFTVNISYGQTTNVTVNYSATGLVPGTIIDVPVVFNSTANVGTWQVVLYYNRDVLTYSSCDFDPVWTGLASPGVYVNLLLPVTGSEYPGQYATKVSWLSTITPPACNNRTAFTLHFVYNGGSTAIEVINPITTTTTTPAYKSLIKNPSANNITTVWTDGLADGPKVPITSKVAGGLWSSPSTWTPANVPSVSTNTEIFIGSTASPVVVDANLTVANNVTINSGAALTVNAGKTFTTTANFTIKNDGSFINMGASANTATVERMIAKDNSWHFLASPVDGAAIKPNFAPTVADNSFDFYRWDETEQLYLPGHPWTNIRNASGNYVSGFDNFEIGRGYLVAYSNSYAASATHSFVGTLGNGNKTITVSNSNNHFNLLGNPYPSAIDWDATAWGGDKTALFGPSASIRIWNETAGNYGVYSGGIGTNGVSNVIARDQSFFVEAIAAGSLVIPADARVHGTQAFLKSTAADLLKLKVSTTANTYSDEMIVRFDANTITGGIAKWPSLIAAAPSLYSVNNNENLTVNTLTALNSNLVVPVGFKAGVNGTYVIKASELNSFTTTTYVYLKDLTTNTVTDLNQNSMYAFTATTNDNANRFQLIFAMSALGISNNVIENTSIYSYDNSIYVNSNETIQQIAIYNTLGQLIKTIENKNGSIVVDMNGNPSAYYIVRVVTSKNVYSEKVLVK